MQPRGLAWKERNGRPFVLLSRVTWKKNGLLRKSECGGSLAEGGRDRDDHAGCAMHARAEPSFSSIFSPLLEQMSNLSLSPPQLDLDSRIWRGEFPMEWRCGRSNFALPVSSLTQSNQIDCRPFGCHVRQSTATTTSAVSSQSSFNDRSHFGDICHRVTMAPSRHLCVCYARMFVPVTVPPLD